VTKDPPLRTRIDWDSLRRQAQEVAARAYAPYSGLAVGAAGVAEGGLVVTGCNVENASFGLTLCAECGVVSALRAAGAGPLVGLSVCTADGRPLSPCGRCRQLLLEHGGPGLLVDQGSDASPLALSLLLPGAFDSGELERRRAQ
jgi:cytidine deaminase